MKRSDPLTVRVYGRLLGWLVPSLRGGYARDAAEVFGTLAREAWASGPRAFLGLVGREISSVVHTAFSEPRARKKERTAAQGDAPGPSGTGDPPGGREPWWKDNSSGKGVPGFAPLARLLDTLALDVRYAVRSLARTPVFVLVTVLSLTFGIAISTVLFSVANAAFVRPLPYAESPGELVRIFAAYQAPSRLPVSFPEFLDLRDATTTLADVAVARGRSFYVGSAAEASRRVEGREVSENYFEVLGIAMARGRGFLKEDIDAGRNVAVIGHNLWQRRFAGDPGVLGEELLLDGRPYTVVGVGPPGMVSPDSPVLLEVVIPATEHREDRGYMAYTGIARLKEGVSLAQAQAELDVFARQMAEAYPEYWEGRGGFQRGLNILTPHEAMIPDDSTFWLAVGGFLVAVGLILLISCSNVANLLLTRALKRRGEIAVRAAMGARSRRILAQLLTENLILFGMAGVASLIVIRGLVFVIGGGLPFLPPVGANFDVDGRVVAFTFGLSLLAGLTFGLLPAVRASRPDLVPALKGRVGPLRFRRFGIRNLLVGVQVGGSAVFVMVTLFLLQSLSYARHLDLGFDPQGVAVLSMNLAHSGYGEEEGRQFLASLETRLESISGVEGAEVSTWVPLEGGATFLGGLEPEGYTAAPDERVSAGMTVVSPGYLDLLRVKLLRGRGLLPEDVAGGERVALVSQGFVERYWPGESGVGKWIRREDAEPIRVVGVVDDVPMRSPAEDPGPHLWLPLSQWYDGEVVVHVRTTSDPRTLLPELRRQVADLDPDLPVLRVDLMENVTANGTLPQRVLSLVMGIAGAVALALAMMGIYGVVAFQVGQRTREMGLRMALGAEPGSVIRMVVREGLGIAMVGLVPGVLLSLAVARLMRAFLLGADPWNPLGLTFGLGLLVLSAVSATLAPALRAARAHPMVSLRTE